ncbi:MAG: thioredoxin family protein [Candidatus Obscuribacter sp.]|nr:thioredoxin family protein [Candidatus Obscuribacter sp.]
MVEKYDVRGVPAFVLFKQAKVVNSTAGEMTKDELARWVKQELDLPTS